MSAILIGNKKGILTVEILVVIAIIAIVLTSLFSLATFSLKVSALVKQSSSANTLAQEAIEAVRSFRDSNSWANGLGILTVGSSNPHYPQLDTSVSPAKWLISDGTETTGIYARKIIIDKVSRDPSSKNIEDTYNSLHDDPDTRKITATVSWNGKKVEIATFLTNWR